MVQARLILDDGTVFTGTVFAKGPDRVGEVIFNTAMSGYEEVLTDPSYHSQIVVMTYPLIGNYGINTEDNQSKNLHLEGLIVHEYLDFPSNFKSKLSLKEYLEKNEVLGVEGIDTRKLTRHIRQHGAKKSLLTTSTDSTENLLKQLNETNAIEGENLAAVVSTKTRYEWKKPAMELFKVAVIDCGVKFGILDQLQNAGCAVSVFPYTTRAEEILKENFDGVLISNGPGQPDTVVETIRLIQNLAGKLPMFGICLGHQMLSIAFGMPIMKLRFGHHGLNHPVKNLISGKVEITSQNHIYCTDPSTLHPDFEVTHVNLNDQSIAGIRSEKYKAFSVQHHPEAAPGPNDSTYLFDEFTFLMKNGRFTIPSQERVEQYAKA